MTFYEWVIRLQKRDTPTGDLAQDIARDANFPKDSSLDEIEQYLSKKATCDGVLDTFKTAKQSYLNYIKTHSE